MVAVVDDLDATVGKALLQFGSLLVQIVADGGTNASPDHGTDCGATAAGFGVVAKGGTGCGPKQAADQSAFAGALARAVGGGCGVGTGAQRKRTGNGKHQRGLDFHVCRLVL